MTQSLTANQQNISTQNKQNIIEQSTAVVRKIFNAANDKQYLKGLDYYSSNEHACFVSDGRIQTLEQLKQSYIVAGAAVEDLHNDIIDWNINVLSEALVAFTLPVKLRLKLIGVPEYTGEIIWSALLQKTAGNWLVVQSHESWLNPEEMVKALSMKE